MRGKPQPCKRCASLHGLIPACAGKTFSLDFLRKNSGAHPRVCGENPMNVMDSPPKRGSSPRVRGKHPFTGTGHLHGGLIPACAGKTEAPRHVLGDGQAHPRVCGENVAAEIPAGIVPGSSPRVRGKRVCKGHDVLTRGLIPACAGKTRCAIPINVASVAHPRVCGENPLQRQRLLQVVGSSPRVRGKQRPLASDVSHVGLIPACAGKTALQPSSLRQPPAHPRVCGENKAVPVYDGLSWGSSPRVRGKR